MKTKVFWIAIMTILSVAGAMAQTALPFTGNRAVIRDGATYQIAQSVWSSNSDLYLDIENSFEPTIGYQGDSDGNGNWGPPDNSGQSNLGRQYIKIDVPGLWTRSSGGKPNLWVRRIANPTLTVGGTSKKLSEWGTTITVPSGASAVLSLDPWFCLPKGTNRLMGNGSQIGSYGQSSYSLSGTGTVNYVLSSSDGVAEELYNVGFALNFASTPTQYTINISSNNNNWGTVSGGGTVNEGANVTVVATAKTNYRFVNWTEGGNPVSTNATYTFSATKNRTLVANFEVIPPTQYTINVSSNNNNWGSVSGGGTVNEGANVTVVATAKTNYRFVNWTESGNPVSTDASYTFSATKNRTLVANFEVIPPTQYTINVSPNNTNWGSVSGGGTVNEGANVTVVATAKTNYRFVNWTEGGNPVSTDASYTFSATKNRTLVANFEVIAPTTYALSVSSGTGSGNYEAGEVVNIAANAPPTGQQFKNWTSSNGGTFGNANASSTTFTMPSNTVTITANYEDIPVTIYTIVSSAGSGGTISPSGTVTVTQGESETFTWTPADGYEVEAVEVNGSIISTTENSYTFSNVQANGTISVSFRSVTAIEDINPASLKIWSPSSGTIRISSEEIILEVRVYTLTGSLSRIISPNSGEVTISNLPQGVVIVRVQTQSGTHSVKWRIEN